MARARGDDQAVAFGSPPRRCTVHTAVHETSMGRQPESRRARAQVRPRARVRQDGPMGQAGGLNVGVTSPSRQNDRATPAIARWLRCRLRSSAERDFVCFRVKLGD
jgi:hypothetical protein